jgi:low affinity Fe/Cu permease
VETQRVSAYARLRALFERFADFLSTAIGTPPAFMLALAAVVIWALLGPAAGFSNTWQLIINTGTTIVTFLMVFLLANSSNRITENQEEMLSRIYDQEEQLDAEERLVKKVLERIDRRHIGPIMKHLDDQDRAMEAVARQVLEAVHNLSPPGAQPK